MRQPSKWDHDYAMVICPILVPFDAENAARLPTSATKQHKITDFAIEPTSDIPTITKDEAANCWIIRETIRNRKLKKRLQKLSQSRGDIPQTRNIRQSLKNEHYQGMKITLIYLWKMFCHSYMLCTLKAIYIVGCVELRVPDLVLYDFQNF